MTKEEFKQKFAKIKQQGFIKTQRSGNTGVGHTLEQLLGLKENNDPLPDLGFAELKAHREGVSSLISLFTFDRGAWIGDKKSLIRDYGTPDPNTQGRQNLYFTMRNDDVTSTGLHLFGTEEYVSIYAPTVQENDGIVAKWGLEELAKVFNRKIPALVIVTAEVQNKLGFEHFHYKKAVLYRTTTKDLIRQNLINGTLTVDLRMHTAMHNAALKVRNHGTAFRAREDRLKEIFSYSEVLG